MADIEQAIFVSGGSSGGSGPLALVMSLWGSSSARRETHEGLAQVSHTGIYVSIKIITFVMQLFNCIADNGYRFLYIATKPDASQKVGVAVHILIRSDAHTTCGDIPVYY